MKGALKEEKTWDVTMDMIIGEMKETKKANGFIIVDTRLLALVVYDNNGHMSPIVAEQHFQLWGLLLRSYEAAFEYIVSSFLVAFSKMM